ncbi:MAG: ATP-dependent metallopeptidase FtsH/Yme1/Tma family protein [Planctomycetes bacterium]|nr:ATP-dependent metallopeptidase FtsH/Yme1/Tma family protein [Planctomycetota bacterium]
MNKRLKTLLVWIVLIGVFLWVFSSMGSRPEPFSVAFDVFREDVEAGRVAAVDVVSNEITYSRYDSESQYVTFGMIDYELTQSLSDQGIVIGAGEKSGGRAVWVYFVVGGVVLLALFLFLRRMSGGPMGGIQAFSRSRAKLISESSQVTFADVGGCREAKTLLRDVVDFLNDSRRWVDAGVRLPRGVLLEGPPGCGKTLLARAVAGETKAKFYLVSASEFVEMFVGVGAARVRDMFETAVKDAPAVIFIDELDAVGRRRGSGIGSGIGSGHDEREQTLNQLLVCLDGFQANDRVVVLAATNRPDILDKALLRSGRIDRRIKIPELTREEQLEILEIHTRDKPLSQEMRLESLAGLIDGYNGSQLENLANEAALLAVRRSGDDGAPPRIRQDDFLQALRPLQLQRQLFDKLDAVLVESATQLAEPTGRAVVRLTLRDRSIVEGEVLWADATFVKVHCDGSATIVSKAQIQKVEALRGTELAGSEDVATDPWGREPPGLA